jgi:hypothetical protein
LVRARTGCTDLHPGLPHLRPVERYPQRPAQRRGLTTVGSGPSPRWRNRAREKMKPNLGRKPIEQTVHDARIALKTAVTTASGKYGKIPHSTPSGVPSALNQPRPLDTVAPGTCLKCGLVGKHRTAMECVRALRDRLARWE